MAQEFAAALTHVLAVAFILGSEVCPSAFALPRTSHLLPNPRQTSHLPTPTLRHPP